jgi:alkaline phosphatase
MMNKLLYSIFLIALSITIQAQTANPSKVAIVEGSQSVFSHNDYLQQVPLYAAYLSGVGFVEADIFLHRAKLVVAHAQEEISEERNLEDMYLRPLRTLILKNGGRAYADSTRRLTLMIDIKSESAPTLKALVALLGNYKELTTCKTLRIVISGNMPAPADWGQYPSFLNFDGRPSITYSAQQLARIALISDSFARYSKWNGSGELIAEDAKKVATLRDEVHNQGKQIRLWGTPDTSNAWATFMKLGIDVINTDHPQDAVTFVTRFRKDNFEAQAKQSVYRPVRTFAPTAVPKNVILLIADGTGLAQFYSGFTANHGSLNIFNLGTVGLSITKSADAYITDSAAGATAFATGKKTNNHYVGVDSVGTRLPTIAEQLKQRGYHIAIASCGDITDATPASFYAHVPDRGMSEAIAQDFMSSNIDILIGAGLKSFTARSDKQNLFVNLRKKGYAVSDRLASLDTMNTTRFVVIDDVAGLRKSNGRGDFLTTSFKMATAMSVKSKHPFFMMFEGAQVDWGGHSNDLPYLTTELLDFDAMVGEALKFADGNGETLVIVTADHETGGLSLLGGDFTKGAVRGSFSTGGHTAIPVPVFAFGPGAQLFTGVYNNTEIYYKMMKLLSGSKEAGSTKP